jgi:plastocyanin
MKRSSLLALTVLLLTIAGCGSSSSSSSSSGATGGGTSSTGSATSSSTSAASSSAAAGGGTIKVTMKNLAFAPSSVNAKVGETVQWVNDDSPPHNVTYVSGPKFASSGTMNTGDKFSVKLTGPGTIHYVCTIHPFMKATIVVSK